MKKFKTVTAQVLAVILLALSSTVELAHQHGFGGAVSFVENEAGSDANPSNPTLRFDCRACTYSLLNVSTVCARYSFAPFFIELIFSPRLVASLTANIFSIFSTRAPPTVLA